TSWNLGGQVQNPTQGPVFRPLRQAVQAQDPLAGRGRGRVYGISQGTSAPPPARTGPPFRPAGQAVRARLAAQPALRGRSSSSPGSAPRNPSAGPAFVP